LEEIQKKYPDANLGNNENLGEKETIVIFFF
jgi:hypothetical protein